MCCDQANDDVPACPDVGGELDQIQFLPGHASIQTIEEYLGCKQRLNDEVNDRIGIEPNC